MSFTYKKYKIKSNYPVEAQKYVDYAKNTGSNPILLPHMVNNLQLLQLINNNQEIPDNTFKSVKWIHNEFHNYNRSVVVGVVVMCCVFHIQYALFKT